VQIIEILITQPQDRQRHVRLADNNIDTHSCQLSFQCTLPPTSDNATVQTRQPQVATGQRQQSLSAGLVERVNSKTKQR